MNTKLKGKQCIWKNNCVMDKGEKARVVHHEESYSQNYIILEFFFLGGSKQCRRP